MDIERLRCFVAVVDHGSFVGAAQRLHRSTSSVSRSVRDLEHWIGAELLVRGHHLVEPTAAGRALLGPGRDVLDGFDGLAVLVRRHITGRRPRLGAVGTLPGPMLERFQELVDEQLGAEPGSERRPGPGSGTGPEADLTLGSSATLMADLDRGAVDLALVHTPSLRASVTALPVLQFGWEVAVASRHPLAGRPVLSFADLTGIRMALPPREVHPPAMDALATRLTGLGVRPDLGAGADLEETAHRIRLGEAVTFVHHRRYQGKALMYQGPCYALVPLADRVPEFTLGLAFRTGSELVRHHPDLVDGVIDRLRAWDRELRTTDGTAPVPGAA